MDLPPTSTMHASTGDLGLGQEGQRYGAQANEMRLWRGVGSVARIAEGRTGDMATSTSTHGHATDKWTIGNMAAPHTWPQRPVGFRNWPEGMPK